MYIILNWRKTNKLDSTGYVIQEALVQFNNVILGWFVYDWKTRSIEIDGIKVYDWENIR